MNLLVKGILSHYTQHHQTHFFPENHVPVPTGETQLVFESAGFKQMQPRLMREAMSLRESSKRRTSFSVPLSVAAQIETRMPRAGSFGALPSRHLSEDVPSQTGPAPEIGVLWFDNPKPTIYEPMPIGRTISSAGAGDVTDCTDCDSTDEVPFVYSFDRAECLEPVRTWHNSLTKGEADMARYLVGELPPRSTERCRLRQPHLFTPLTPP